MRILLDTNIVIHRENHYVSNYSVGHLYKWLDKLKLDKFVHEFSVGEILRYGDDPKRLEALKVKLESYEILESTPKMNQEFVDMISSFANKPNDEIDNILLYEVYLGRVDLLVTEDLKMLKKSKRLSISDKVFTINQIITFFTSHHPELIDYSVLSVKKKKFSEIDINNMFFNTFREDYKEFNKWFYKKCNEYAYVCEDGNEILGFLYLKVEDDDEAYHDISPSFIPAKRMKIGTFKVESTGFRLGERFVKIIFDNALQYRVDEIYVTLFDNRAELQVLKRLLCSWGFFEYGVKNSNAGLERVLVKSLCSYDKNLNPKKNFPNLSFDCSKYLLPIKPEFHTTLLPDSHLKNENLVNLLEKKAHQYALQKIYISQSFERSMKKGDLILFYRMGDRQPKRYSSVVTTLGIIEDIQCDFNCKEQYLKTCQNRTVFDLNTLESLWKSYKENLVIVTFIVVRELNKKVTLSDLYDIGAIEPPGGPRPFTKLSNNHFLRILEIAESKHQFVSLEE